MTSAVKCSKCFIIDDKINGLTTLRRREFAKPKHHANVDHCPLAATASEVGRSTAVILDLQTDFVHLFARSLGYRWNQLRSDFAASESTKYFCDTSIDCWN